MEEFGDASNSDSLIHCSGQECEMEKFSSGMERPSFEEINGTHTYSSQRGDRDIMKRQADVYRLLLILFDLASVVTCWQKHTTPLCHWCRGWAGQQREYDKECKQASNRWKTEWPITRCCKNHWLCGTREGDEVNHSDKWYLSHKLPSARTAYMSRQVSS